MYIMSTTIATAACIRERKYGLASIYYTELPQHAVEDHFLKYTFDISSTCDIVSLQVQSKKNMEL